MSTSTTILLVEDQRDLRDLVQRVLEKEGFDVIAVGDGESALDIARLHQPDLIILDLTLPTIDGLDVCRALRRDAKLMRLPVVILSARGSESDRILGLELGADDYLSKPFSGRELVARTRAVLRRSRPNLAESQTRKVGNLEIDTLRHEARLSGRKLNLRRSEFNILNFLASEPGRVFSRDEIIDGALNREISVTERTIDVHITKIRQQLDEGVKILQTVRGIGYRLSAE